MIIIQFYFCFDLQVLIYSLINNLSLQKSAFHRPQTLGYKNGYALSRRPAAGIGQDPLLSEQLIQQEISELSLQTHDMTYGSYERDLPKDFIPAHVALDKKVKLHLQMSGTGRFFLSSITFLLCLFFTTRMSRRCCASMHTLWKKSCAPLKRTAVCAPWSFTTTLRMTAFASLSPQCRIPGCCRGNGSNASVSPRMNTETITCGKT